MASRKSRKALKAKSMPKPALLDGVVEEQLMETKVLGKEVLPICLVHILLLHRMQQLQN